MIQVTMREWRLLTFIQHYTQQHGYSPSSRDILKGCGYTTTSTVQDHLKKLEAAGVLTRGERRNRTIVLCAVQIGVAP